MTAPRAAHPLASLQEPLQMERSRWLAAPRRGVGAPRVRRPSRGRGGRQDGRARPDGADVGGRPGRVTVALRRGVTGTLRPHATQQGRPLRTETTGDRTSAVGGGSYTLSMSLVSAQTGGERPPATLGPDLAAIETGVARWFGDPDRPLLGWLSTPREGVSSAGVLVLPAVGYSYWSSPRTMRVLAERLAAAGHTVLRFDYEGTGDSGGDQWDDDRVASWRASAAAPAQVSCVRWDAGVSCSSAHASVARSRCSTLRRSALTPWLRGSLSSRAGETCANCACSRWRSPDRDPLRGRHARRRRRRLLARRQGQGKLALAESTARRRRASWSWEPEPIRNCWSGDRAGAAEQRIANCAGVQGARRRRDGARRRGRGDQRLDRPHGGPPEGLPPRGAPPARGRPHGRR